MVLVVDKPPSSEPDDPEDPEETLSAEPLPDEPPSLVVVVGSSCEASVVVSSDPEPEPEPESCEPEPEVPEPDLLESSLDAVCSPPDEPLPDEPLWSPEPWLPAWSPETTLP